MALPFEPRFGDAAAGAARSLRAQRCSRTGGSNEGARLSRTRKAGLGGEAEARGCKEPTDAIVKITTTTICGTDLHILKGDVPTVTDGRILGHEGVGVVEEVGPAVSTFKRATGSSSRASRRAGSATLQEGHVLALRDGAAGSSATPSTARRPSTCGSRTPTRASTSCRRASTRCARHAERHPPHRLRVRRAQRRREAGRHRRDRRRGPVGLAALLTAQFYSPAESSWWTSTTTGSRSRRGSARPRP